MMKMCMYEQSLETIEEEKTHCWQEEEGHSHAYYTILTQCALTYNNTGLAMYERGDLDGALKMYNRCLELQEKVLLGKDDEHDAPTSTRSTSFSSTPGVDTAPAASIAITYSNIGMVMEDKGDFDGALKMYEKCLKIEEKILGCDHPSTVDTFRNIVSVKMTMMTLTTVTNTVQII